MCVADVCGRSVLQRCVAEVCVQKCVAEVCDRSVWQKCVM